MPEVTTVLPGDQAPPPVRMACVQVASRPQAGSGAVLNPLGADEAAGKWSSHEDLGVPPEPGILRAVTGSGTELLASPP